jgi:hypothetical protein
MKERCIFDKPIYKGDGDLCEGPITQHHVLYRCEGGKQTRSNLIPMCRHHQDWVHSKNVWGGEDFSNLKITSRSRSQ